MSKIVRPKTPFEFCAYPVLKEALEKTNYNQTELAQSLGTSQFTVSAWVRGDRDTTVRLLIAHPPCTYLTVAGAANIPKHPERIQQGEEAAAFFMAFYNSEIPRIAIENPVPMRRFGLPPYTQIIRPYMFGHNNGKPVCLWLKNLPVLFATDIVPCNPELTVWTYKGRRKSMSKWYNVGDRKDRAKLRSKTFPGIAKAMAEQWGGDIRECEGHHGRV